MEFKHFFNTYDTTGTQHTGFLQAMNFSDLTGTVTFLNELTMAFMDAYLYNELSNSLVMRQWGQYMHYSRENERFEIMATFYQDFVNALAAKLIRAEKWYQLTKINFQSLSATDIKTIEHGMKETVKDYGEDETTRAYGEDEQTNIYGQKQDTNAYGVAERTNLYGQVQDTNQYGQKVNTNAYAEDETETVYGDTKETQERGEKVLKKAYDNVVVTVSHDGDDTHTIGVGHAETETTTTNLLYPLGAAAYVDDTKQTQHSETDTDEQVNKDSYADVETSTGARNDKETAEEYTDTIKNDEHTDTTTRAARTDTLTEGQHTDTLTTAQHTDTITDAAHTDTLTKGQHTDTLTRSEREDVETRAARRDTEQIKAYVDTERHTKHIIISPEKYYAIEKELADIGVYELMKDAVRETMLLCVWEGGYLW